jgi:AMIN domain
LPVSGGPSVEIQHVSVLKSAGATEIEIATSQRVTPEVQVITGPDRLVLDFPQSLPGARLRAVAVNQGEVKGVRVGLLTAKPPVTRVVLDLKSPQAYQVFPSARSVIVKLPDASGATAASMPSNGAPSADSNAPAAQPPVPAPPPKKVEINVQDGQLSLTSNRASLAEVLSELQRQTGASIVVPPGAEQEVVAVSLGPASPREVISQLLNGSRYNFIIVGADNDPNKVERLLLTPKSPGGVTAEIQTNQPDFVPVAQVQAPDSSTPPPPPPAAPPEEAQPQGDSAPPPDTTPQPGDPQPAPN